VEDLLSGTQVGGPGRLPYLMDWESARAVEEGHPNGGSAGIRVARGRVTSSRVSAAATGQPRALNSVRTPSAPLPAPSCSTS
jgi:hypothetical protein